MIKYCRLDSCFNETKKTLCSRACRILEKCKISKEQFLDIIASSFSWSEVTRQIDSSQNTYTMSHRVRVLESLLEVDSSHFRGQTWNKGLKTSKVSLNTLLDNPNARSGALRKYLILEGIKEAKCERPGCGLSEWFGKPAILELEHVDGDSRNNSLENLRIYCLQCHAQTPSWRRAKSALVGIDIRPEWER